MLKQKIEEFSQTPAGKAVGVALVLALVVFVYLMFRSNFASSDAAALSRSQVYICSETGKPFNVTIEDGLVNPVESPHSGKKTGYPAEICFWTKDGKVRSDGFAVLLNSRVNKPEPTFCPDCSRLVVAYNPGAAEGTTPPPTEAEYKARGANANH